MLQISIFTHFLLKVLFNNYTVLPDEDAYTQPGSQPVYHVLEAPQVSANATGQPNISKIKYGKILESLYSMLLAYYRIFGNFTIKKKCKAITLIGCNFTFRNWNNKIIL